MRIKKRNKAGEEWARRIVEKHLKMPVVINDDGSRSSMYDLRIGSEDAPDCAIECVGAVNAVFTETWNIGPAKGALKSSLKGDWGVEIEDFAQIKEVKRHAESLLRQLEDRGIHDASADWWLELHDEILFKQLKSLQISRVLCYTPRGEGKVNLWMQGMGGAVEQDGGALSNWIGQFLNQPTCNDVRLKLLRSCAPVRHAFVIVSFKAAPWSVECYLTGNLDYLPKHPPALPKEITGVWVVSGVGDAGVFWDGVTWNRFDARGKGIEDDLTKPKSGAHSSAR